MVESFQPLADLVIRSAGECADYRRSLDLRTGTVSVEYSVDGVRFRRETYVSAPDQVMVWTVSADQPGAITLDLRLDSAHPARVEVADDIDRGGGAGKCGVVGHAPSDLTIEYRQSPDPSVMRKGAASGSVSRSAR